MSKVLIKFSRDWADEFQMEGFRAVTPERAEEVKKAFSTPQHAYFGTNEGWDPEHQEMGRGYDHAGGVLANSMEFIEINELEYQVLIKLFPSGGHGFVPNPDYLDEFEE